MPSSMWPSFLSAVGPSLWSSLFLALISIFVISALFVTSIGSIAAVAYWRWRTPGRSRREQPINQTVPSLELGRDLPQRVPREVRFNDLHHYQHGIESNSSQEGAAPYPWQQEAAPYPWEQLAAPYPWRQGAANGLQWQWQVSEQLRDVLLDLQDIITEQQRTTQLQHELSNHVHGMDDRLRRRSTDRHRRDSVDLYHSGNDDQPQEILPQLRNVLPQRRDVLPQQRDVLLLQQDMSDEQRGVLQQQRDLADEQRAMIHQQRGIMEQQRRLNDEYRGIINQQRRERFGPQRHDVRNENRLDEGVEQSREDSTLQASRRKHGWFQRIMWLLGLGRNDIIEYGNPFPHGGSS